MSADGARLHPKSPPSRKCEASVALRRQRPLPLMEGKELTLKPTKVSLPTAELLPTSEANVGGYAANGEGDQVAQWRYANWQGWVNLGGRV